VNCYSYEWFVFELFILQAGSKPSLCALTPDGNLMPSLSINGRILVQNKVSKADAMSFRQNWIQYTNGFGTPFMNDSYWIGNDKLYRLTSGSSSYKLRIEVSSLYSDVED
jgi:hypothetical protein